MGLEQGQSIVIRLAGPADQAALTRLAALDSAEALEGPALLAEVGEEPWAALSLRTGREIADPFRRSAELVALLRVHAEQRDGRPWRAPLHRRLLGRRPVWAESRAAC